jgi:N-acetyl-gamma-glutamylphosphate reductase
VTPFSKLEMFKYTLVTEHISIFRRFTHSTLITWQVLTYVLLAHTHSAEYMNHLKMAQTDKNTTKISYQPFSCAFNAGIITGLTMYRYRHKDRFEQGFNYKNK